MRLLTDFDLQLMFGTALRPCTPSALNELHRDRLCDVLTATLAPCTVLQFSVPGQMHGPTQRSTQTPLLVRNARSRAAFEAAAKDAVLTILAMASALEI